MKVASMQKATVLQKVRSPLKNLCVIELMSGYFKICLLVSTTRKMSFRSEWGTHLSLSRNGSNVRALYNGCTTRNCAYV